MNFSLLQYKRQTLASWSLILVSIVLLVCISQNLGFSTLCPLTPAVEVTEQLQSQEQHPSEIDTQCSNSEHLVNANTIQIDFAILMFILALVIIAAILKQSGVRYFFPEPPTSYGVRRHLAFCTFQE
ncbi:hypothetical protein GLP30_11600 [Photobacterium phosphoreum]|uniref:Copper resistance protein n=1 Tax=Photobacterium phosphoreum TaxID=659 RepID=A0AAW4ZYI2_PHOPO|nr:hypothetical protein [Photobacterium phosphoreum]MCD9463656.1 hypothetical protein [Photobacterium phosphoreum]MCD9474467.1 hypothetical protein [Photobacterium phosphoreum]MCD9491435.1 hypothetical protein [Photobacterium phosphoreum]MCD9512173.1 hypothetical protein [Photobacterium phosphoreum]MCD9517582.1 hypothetical protein [Photobacterium phosphoreum]